MKNQEKIPQTAQMSCASAVATRVNTYYTLAEVTIMNSLGVTNTAAQFNSQCQYMRDAQLVTY